MVNSKKKGNKFELLIAKKLTELTNVKWYRVGVSSGARYTTIGAEKYIGDVTTDAKEFEDYVIECKATKDRITLEDLINPKSKFWYWLEQAERESIGRKFILFFKANHGKIFAVDRGNTFLKNHFLKLNNYFIYKIE